MELILDILSWLFLLGGSFFCLTGALGLLRFPEFFSRIHAASLTDTLGASLILIGLMLQA
ncbi:MAG: monovalent cation/H(+) antiporter subunit G, partial [Gammaproteobacteria bacterium]